MFTVILPESWSWIFVSVTGISRSWFALGAHFLIQIVTVTIFCFALPLSLMIILPGFHFSLGHRVRIHSNYCHFSFRATLRHTRIRAA